MSNWADKYSKSDGQASAYSTEENTLHLFHIQNLRLGALAIMGKRISNPEPLVNICHYFALRINQHYQPTTIGQPCVIFRDDEDEIIPLNPSQAVTSLQRSDASFLSQLFSCLYVEGVDEQGKAHYAYIGIAADHLDEMLDNITENSHLNPHDYHGVVFWHGAEPPNQEVQDFMLGRFDFAEAYITLRLS